MNLPSGVKVWTRAVFAVGEVHIPVVGYPDGVHDVELIGDHPVGEIFAALDRATGVVGSACWRTRPTSRLNLPVSASNTTTRRLP